MSINTNLSMFSFNPKSSMKKETVSYFSLVMADEKDGVLKCVIHDKDLDLYCSRHDEIICEFCIDSKHEGCKDLIDVVHATNEQMSDTEYSEIKRTVIEMEKTIEGYIRDQNENKIQLDDQKVSIAAEIKSFRDKINEHLERLHQDLLDVLSETHDKLKSNIDKTLDELEKKKDKLKSLAKKFENLNGEENFKTKFVVAKMVKKEYARVSKPIQSLVKKLKHSNIEFASSPEAELIALEIESLGAIAISEKQSVCNIPNFKSEDLQLKFDFARNIANINLHLKTEIKIRNKMDLSVQKCVLLPSNQFLFADEKNERLVIHDHDGSHHHDISVSNKPFDIAIIDAHRIAVTYGRERQVEILDISKHKCERIIKTGNDCWGIAFNEGNLFVVVYRKGIDVIGVRGQLIATIPVNVDHVFYVAIHSDKIYFTDWAENTVNCCDFDGNEIWCYGYDNVLSEQGVVTDADGNVYVVGYRTNNVMVTSPDGRRYKIVLSGEKDGLNWPTGLFYDPQGDRLLLCNETDGFAALYDIE